MLKKLLLCLGLLVSLTVNAKDVILTNSNTIVLNDQVDSASVSQVMQEVQKLDSTIKSGEPIYLFLNTPGGSIQDGLELMEYLNSINRPIHTITLFAASMGFQIVQSQGSRLILKNGILMSHEASGGVRGSFSDGNSQLDSRYRLWLARILELDVQTVKRTNGKQTLKSYRESYKNELWLTGTQAVEQGYADEVVTAKCSKEMTGTRDTKINFMGADILISYSQCPLNTNPLSIELLVPTNKGLMKYSEFLSKGGTLVKEDITAELKVTDPTLTPEIISKVRSTILEEIKKRQTTVVKSY